MLTKKEADEKFWSKVIKLSPNRCWQWIGSINGNFGRVFINGKQYKAHIYSWEMHNNKKFPQGGEITHLCNDKLCVNPNHLKLLSISDRFWSKVNKKSKNECWEWQGAISTSGYGTFQYNKITTMTHRFSYEIHYGKIKNNLHVCHKCDNKLCVNPDHLFLGTAKDNLVDMIKKGRSRRGEMAYNAILTKEQVLEIRKKYKPHIYTAHQLAKEYDTHPSTIYSIIYKISWKWL